MSRNKKRAYLDKATIVMAAALKPLFEKLEACDLALSINGRQLTSVSMVLIQPESDDIRYVSLLWSHKPQVIKLTRVRIGCASRVLAECPVCFKRRSALYFSNSHLACRDCLRLHYLSQSETGYSRLLRRVRKKRIDVWEQSIDTRLLCNLFESTSSFEKPKGVWASKYLESVKCINALESEMSARLSGVLDEMVRN